MKLEKKKAYRAKTQEQFNKILEQAEKQGITWLMGDKATENKNYWNCRKENTIVCVDERGVLTTWCEESARTDGYDVVDFVEEPKVVQINPWCACVDAPDFAAAQSRLDEWLNNMLKRTNEEIMEKMFSEKCYTVRVDGRDVTVITPDGKTATAHCHPDDKFDVVEGIRVALEKIERKNHKLTEKEWTVLNFLDDMGCDTMSVDKGYYIGGERDGETIIELSDVSVEDLFDWLENYESYDIDELMKLDIED